MGGRWEGWSSRCPRAPWWTMITAAARPVSPAVQEPVAGRQVPPDITAHPPAACQSLMTLAGVASQQLHLHSEAATRAPAVEQVARDAELMQVRVAEAEQAGRDAELAQGCEAAEAAPASASPGEVAERPGRRCEPRNPSTGSLRPQVVEKCCPKCGPFKRTYDRLAVGSIVASLRLNGPMGGKRRHLLRGKELWLYLCRRHDQYVLVRDPQRHPPGHSARGEPGKMEHIPACSAW